MKIFRYGNIIKKEISVNIAEVIMDYLTTTEMAEKWNVSRRRIATYCKEGRVDGAFLKGKTWLIPEDAEKPKDPRKNAAEQK